MAHSHKLNPKVHVRKLVIVNLAANYLTIGLANAFGKRFAKVVLITGSVHTQGEELAPDVGLHFINRWHERPVWKKAASYVVALTRMWFLLVTKYRAYEVLFVSVPPMGYLLNLVVRNRFSMVIWDIYPDVLRVTGMRPTDMIYRCWAKLNSLSFARAWRLFTIGDVLADSLSKYTDRNRIIVHPIWSIFQENQRLPPEHNPFVRANDLYGRFVVQYSGNIGLTHNVEILVDVADRMQCCEDVVFQIIGRGSQLPRIEGLVKERNLSNVQILPFQADESFPLSLSAASLGVVILHDSASQGSVPSKAFNLMSFGIPSLYIAKQTSQLAKYADTFKHAKCLTSNNIDDIASFILQLVSDQDLAREMARNAEAAARQFRRSNADRFVESYFQNA